MIKLNIRSVLLEGRFFQILILFFLFIFVSVCLLGQQMDELEQQLLLQKELPLRWENIEGAPYWITGPKPDFKARHHQHIVHLAPGETIILRIEGDKILRGISIQEKMHESDVVVSHSNGTGLHLEISPIFTEDGLSFVLFPASTAPSLIRIQRPAFFKTGLSLAFFVSAYDVPMPLLSYEKDVKLPVETVSLRRGDQNRVGHFALLKAGKSLSIEVTGPQRLELETRFQYDTDSSEPLQTYSIFCFLEKSYWQTVEFHSTLERQFPVYVDGRIQAVGRSRSAFLEIPAGKKLLRLETTGPIYVAIKSLNETFETPAKKKIQQKPFENPEKEALKQVQTKGKRENGLAGTSLMQEWEKQWPLTTSSRLSSDDLWYHHTFYRSVLPWKKDNQGVQLKASYFNRQVRNGDADRFPNAYRIFPQFLDEDINNVPSGDFFPLNSTALDYYLPDLGAPSRLRVVVAAPNLQEDIQLTVQFDKKKTHHLTFYKKPEISPQDMEISIAESPIEGFLTLFGLGGAINRRVCLNSNRNDVTLNAFLTANLHRFYPWLNTGYVEIPLPRGVNQVHITGQWQHEHKTLKHPLYIAVAYRASRPFQWSETQYLEAAKQNNGVPYFNQLLAIPREEQTDLWSAHHQPLLRFLRSRWQTFSISIRAREDERKTLQAPLTAAQAWKIREEALGFEKEKQPLVALENWNQLVQRGPNVERSTALMGRIRCLEALEEYYLAELQLKGLILHETDGSLRVLAISYLYELYQCLKDEDKELTLRAVEAYLQPSERTLGELCRVLTENGEFVLAVQVGMFLPPQQRPMESMLRSALASRQFQVLALLLQDVPVAQRLKWQALAALTQGNVLEALTLFKKAGAQEYVKTVQRGLELRSALLSLCLGRPISVAPITLLREWNAWQTTLPGPHVWQEAGSLIGDCAGTATLYTLERDMYATLYRAEQAHPIKIEVLGPTKLLLRVRPLHDDSQPGYTGTLDTWLKVAVDEGLRHVPITGNRPTPGLLIIGPEEENFQAGTKIETEVEVGPGLHHISIWAEEIPILLQVFFMQPVFNFNLLPQLNPYTSRLFLKGPHSVLLEEMNLNTDSQQRLQPLEPMAELVMGAEKEKLNANNYAAEAMQYYQKEKARMELYPLFSRLRTKVAWEALDSVVESAGLQPVLVSGRQPESPFIRIRHALLPISDSDIKDKGLILMSTTETLSWDVVNLKPLVVTADFSVLTLDYMALEPLAIALQLDGEPFQTVILDAKHGKQNKTFTIPAGTHNLSFFALTYLPDHFIQVDLSSNNKNGILKNITDGITHQVTRYYHLTTEEEPLHMQLDGPTWLRIDELKAGRTFSQYLYIPQSQEPQDVFLLPGSRITWNRPVPKSSRLKITGTWPSRSIYRLFRQVFPPAEAPLWRRPENTDPSPLPFIANTQKNKAETYIKGVAFKDVFRLGSQEDPTWSLEVGRYDYGFGETENDFQETRDTSDRYFQLSLSRRFYNPFWASYSKTELLFRLREWSTPSFGFQHRIWWHPYATPLLLELSAAAFVQNPDEAEYTLSSGEVLPPQPFARGGWVGAAFIQAQVRWRQPIGQKIVNAPGVRIWGRYLSMKEEQFSPSLAIDRDVFSPYQEDHALGLTIEDLITVRPWIFTRWWAALSLTTNTNFNPLKPDYTTLQAGWKQLLGWLQVDFDYRWRRYYRDSDRRWTRDAHYTTLKLFWDIWPKDHRRMEFGAQFTREWLLKQNSFSIFFAWHLGKGRDYLDFSESELDFKALKEQHLFFKPSLLTNQIKLLVEPTNPQETNETDEPDDADEQHEEKEKP